MSPRRQRRWLTPRRKAAIRRAAKFMVYSILGALLVNAGALIAYALMGLHLGPDAVAVGSMLAGSSAAGIAKAVRWQEEVGMSNPVGDQIPTIANPGGN